MEKNIFTKSDLLSRDWNIQILSVCFCARDSSLQNIKNSLKCCSLIIFIQETLIRNSLILCPSVRHKKIRELWILASHWPRCSYHKYFWPVTCLAFDEGFWLVESFECWPLIILLVSHMPLMKSTRNQPPRLLVWWIFNKHSKRN